MNGPVLVTGASGVLGRAVVAALSDAGIVIMQGVRNPEKARTDVECVRLDYSEAATFPPALTGMRGLMLMAPPLDSDAPAKLGPVISCAKSVGVNTSS